VAVSYRVSCRGAPMIHPTDDPQKLEIWNAATRSRLKVGANAARHLQSLVSCRFSRSSISMSPSTICAGTCSGGGRKTGNMVVMTVTDYQRDRAGDKRTG
jgi:hypothetical protein